MPRISRRIQPIDIRPAEETIRLNFPGIRCLLSPKRPALVLQLRQMKKFEWIKETSIALDVVESRRIHCFHDSIANTLNIFDHVCASANQRVDRNFNLMLLSLSQTFTLTSKSKVSDLDKWILTGNNNTISLIFTQNTNTVTAWVTQCASAQKWLTWTHSDPNTMKALEGAFGKMSQMSKPDLRSENYPEYDHVAPGDCYRAARRVSK